MPTFDPHYNPIQPDDAKWNAEMARKEEERRARGTMPTTVVGPNGASPGKNIYGRTPEEEKAYREDLARRQGAKPAPAQPAAPSGTGDSFADFRAQQQAENRRRIASGARSRANAALAQFEAQDAEEAKAKAALRQSQNDKAYTLWTALGGQNKRVLGMAANDFAQTFNEQMQGRGEIVNTKLAERDDGKGGKESYFIFTAKMPDGTTKPFTYGRKELQDKLMRHGYAAESFTDEPAPKEEAKAAPADFNKDFFGSLNPAAKARYANGERDGFTEADFIQPQAPEVPKAPEDTFAKERAAYKKERLDKILETEKDFDKAVALADSQALKLYPMPGGASAAPAVSGAQGDSLSSLEERPAAGESGAPAPAGGEGGAAQPQQGAPEEYAQGKAYKPGDTVAYKGHSWKLGMKGWELADGKPPEKPAEKPFAAPADGANPAPSPSPAPAPAPATDGKPAAAAAGGPPDASSKAYEAIMALRNEFPGDERIRKATDDILAEFMGRKSESDARSADLRSRIDAGNAKTAAANERAAASKERRAKDEEFAKNYGRTPAELLNNIRGVLYRGQDMTAVQGQAGLGDFMQNLADARGRDAAVNGEANRSQRNDPVGEMLQGGKTLPPGVKMLSLKKENVRTTVGKNGARDRHVTKNGEAERDRLRDLLEPALVPRSMLGANMRETKDAYEFYVTEKAFADLFNLQKKRFEST